MIIIFERRQFLFFNYILQNQRKPYVNEYIKQTFFHQNGANEKKFRFIFAMKICIYTVCFQLEYRFISKKGEGTFSQVLKAKCLATNELVATKCMKEQFSSIEQVNSLREIQALKRLNPHPNIINLYEVILLVKKQFESAFFDTNLVMNVYYNSEKKTGRLSLVFELMSMNLYELIRKTKGYVTDEKIQLYMNQLCKAIDHMHKRGVFHRDIKPENILIRGDVLKLADFGSCRGKYSKQPFTEYISTRWYRAPECLLTDGYYCSKMDIWGIGCVFFEVIALFPLFPGTNELDQIDRIHRVLGTPSLKLYKSFQKFSRIYSCFTHL